ncbi:hypothetical protein EKN06_11610 [Croceicoccus ponticola]|uniref:Uncharacterized protein n=1 Tax=Croceicoccus ponticola TaxID=2217664 RepID=A0A437GVU4_9SPHN|nr:hypothetical protein [Croceicoccus ponticola]RVQ65994.1 hypothetical protein EKN06_11610 [Croceicoccus ponticola]
MVALNELLRGLREAYDRVEAARAQADGNEQGEARTLHAERNFLMCAESMARRIPQSDFPLDKFLNDLPG